MGHYHPTVHTLQSLSIELYVYVAAYALHRLSICLYIIVVYLEFTSNSHTMVHRGPWRLSAARGTAQALELRSPHQWAWLRSDL
jgi:hypothetical protein